jgi:hypothetical protein
LGGGQPAATPADLGVNLSNPVDIMTYLKQKGLVN